MGELRKFNGKRLKNKLKTFINSNELSKFSVPPFKVTIQSYRERRTILRLKIKKKLRT